MKSKFRLLGLAALAAVGIAASAHGFAQSAGVDLLEGLERGRWQLRAVGGGPLGSPVSQLCLGDPRLLAQIQHGSNLQCTQLVIRSSATSVTISYSCKGAGQGLTTIRKESGQLVQIQSQGISNNSPFSFAVEARRSGTC